MPKPKEHIWKHEKHVIESNSFEIAGVPLYLNPADETVSRKMFLRGWHEPLQVQKIKECAVPGSVCIDIGAHVGFYAGVLATIIGPSGKVIAFEPSSENYKYLKKNALLYKNIVAENCAVADTTGEMALYLAERNRGDHRIYQPPEETRSVETIKSVALSDYLHQKAISPETVSVIKIDAQGAEPKIFKGMADILPKLVNATLFIEFWPISYREQNVPIEAYLRFLHHTFTIHDLNYVLKTYQPILSPENLDTLCRNHLDEVNGVSHSTLVLGYKKAADLQALMQAGITQYRQGNMVEAEETFEQILAVMPRNTDVLVSLGKMYFETNRYQKAMDRFMQAIQADSRDVDAWVGLALIAQKVEQQDFLAKAVEMIQLLEPSHPKLAEFAAFK